MEEETITTILLTATYQDGYIIPDRPLPLELEGKKIQIFLQELERGKKKRRTCGSAKGQVWMSPDFDEPLPEFESYYS